MAFHDDAYMQRPCFEIVIRTTITDLATRQRMVRQVQAVAEEAMGDVMVTPIRNVSQGEKVASILIHRK